MRGVDVIIQVTIIIFVDRAVDKLASKSDNSTVRDHSRNSDKFKHG